jgi:hypothetical protein
MYAVKNCEISCLHCSSCLRFEIFIGLLALLSFVFCPTVGAKEQNGWEFDSLRGNPNVSKPDAQQVYEVLLKMLDRGNAHDIEGHLQVYWKSPEKDPAELMSSEKGNCG